MRQRADVGGHVVSRGLLRMLGSHVRSSRRGGDEQDRGETEEPAGAGGVALFGKHDRQRDQQRRSREDADAKEETPPAPGARGRRLCLGEDHRETAREVVALEPQRVHARLEASVSERLLVRHGGRG
jgi:hypothetical protein